MKRNTFPLVSLLALVLCSSSSVFAEEAQAPAQSAPAATAEKPARPTIAAGMTPDQVRSIAGNPDRIKRLKKKDVDAEIWFYKYNTLANVKDVAVKTIDVPYVDPGSGMTKTIPEPVYSQQRTFLVETTELLFVNGVLTSSKRYRTVDKQVD